MNVYYNTRKEPYSGGVILIAANSLQEAMEIFNNSEEYFWLSCYNNTNWKQLEDMNYNGSAGIILESGYSE